MTTSSDDILAGLLAECSDSILAGATVKACLDRHPEHATALEPLLTTLVDVHELHAVPVRSSASAARTREQFMAAAMRLAEERRTPPVTWRERLAAWWAGIVALFVPRTGSRTPGMPVGLLAAMLVVILAGVLVTGGVTASAKALPGDLLYPFKITGERVQLFIARDPVVRSVLEQEFSGRRRQEAKAVVAQRRRVNSLPLDGTLEAINDNHWTVSGLDLTLDPAAQIIGMPTVGARVHGVLRAPGDGRLLVIYAVVDILTGDAAPAPAVTPPTATPTRPRATATATPTATAEETASSTAAASNLPILDRPEPEDWTPAVPVAKSATPTRARTATPRPRPTATPAPTLAPVPTDMPSPRTLTTLRIQGWVERTEGDRWIIDGIPVKVTGATQLINNPTVGWKVEAVVIQDADGYYTALQITGLAPPEATPEPVEFTDILYEMNGEWWTIGTTPVRVSGDTAIEGNPQIGDLVSMEGKRHQSEIWAVLITRIPLTFTVVEFGGIISAVSGSSVVVDGHTVLIDSQTQIVGTLEVGREAEVRAWQMTDGRLIGKKIVVSDRAPTPTKTVTQSPTPTSTSTVEPTPTLTPEPTSTATAEPTSTLTPEPTSTATAEPTSTLTPEPTSTATAEPTSTLAPEPTSTATAEPTSTLTPEPTAPASLEATASPSAAVKLRYAKAGV
jgi:hypothetical protein